MANIFRISKEEFQFLIMFEEIKQLDGFENIGFLKREEELKAVADSLKSKKYIFVNENGECLLDESLQNLLNIIRKPKGYFVIKSNQSKNFTQVFYFVSNSIVSVSQNERQFEILWIPFITIAIGELANAIFNFKNTRSIKLKEYSIEQEKETIEEYANKNYYKTWEFLAKIYNEEIEEFSALTVENEVEQILMYEKEKSWVVISPDKADYVNNLSKWFVKIHGIAMSEGGES